MRTSEIDTYIRRERARRATDKQARILEVSWAGDHVLVNGHRCTTLADVIVAVVRP